MKFFTAERPKDAALRRPSPKGNKESGKATFPCESRSLRSGAEQRQEVFLPLRNSVNSIPLR